MDKELFFLLQDRLYEEKITLNEEIGGHASVWAKRAMQEGCRAYTTPWPSNFNKKHLKWQGDDTGLIFPVDKMAIDAEVNKPKTQDTHLVLEYKAGEMILGFEAPRSNRFYFVHDPNGSVLEQMSDYHTILDQVEEKNKPYMHMFGGF